MNLACSACPSANLNPTNIFECPVWSQIAKFNAWQYFHFYTTHSYHWTASWLHVCTSTCTSHSVLIITNITLCCQRIHKHMYLKSFSTRSQAAVVQTYAGSTNHFPSTLPSPTQAHQDNIVPATMPCQEILRWTGIMHDQFFYGTISVIQFKLAPQWTSTCTCIGTTVVPQWIYRSECSNRRIHFYLLPSTSSYKQQDGLLVPCQVTKRLHFKCTNLNVTIEFFTVFGLL